MKKQKSSHLLNSVGKKIFIGLVCTGLLLTVAFVSFETCSANEKMGLTFDMRGNEGKFLLLVQPKATLLVDGEDFGTSVKFTVRLPAGKHKIEIRKAGFTTIKDTIEVFKGRPNSKNYIITEAKLDTSEMVLIPAGEFYMGLDKQDLKWIIEKVGGAKRFHKNELPRRKENIPAFYIDKYEVTNAQYKKFVDATKHRAPLNWKNGTYLPGKANHPVSDVSWRDADAYAKWAGKRLPTEKEWEKAARGPESEGGLLFPWGDSFDWNKANTNRKGPGEKTVVGKYAAGKSYYGTYDQCGNVWEWTADVYEDYPGNKYEDEFYGMDEPRVARGGAYTEQPYESLTTCRFKRSPKSIEENIGFRCAKDAK